MNASKLAPTHPNRSAGRAIGTRLWARISSVPRAGQTFGLRPRWCRPRSLASIAGHPGASISRNSDTAHRQRMIPSGRTGWANTISTATSAPFGDHGRSAASVSSFANDALGEQRRRRTPKP
jgi:hypothetical protein